MGIKVKMLEDFQDHKRGNIVIFGNGSGQRLIDREIAKLYKKNKKIIHRRDAKTQRK